MSATDDCIAKVQALIEKQLQLLTLSLFICDMGSADFSDEELACDLSEQVRTVVASMSLPLASPSEQSCNPRKSEESRSATSFLSHDR